MSTLKSCAIAHTCFLLTYSHEPPLSISPCRACFVFHNQASEARQLICVSERNPEVETIAAGASWETITAYRKKAKWG